MRIQGPISGDRKRRPDERGALAASPHPPWLAALLDECQPLWRAATHASPFTEAARGLVPAAPWRHLLADFFAIIESFPKYMGLILAKTTFGQRPGDIAARNWLISNIKVEQLHVMWYVDWAAEYGLGFDELCAHRPHPEVAALDEWLWSIARDGALGAAVAAVNYAIEGTTGEWSRLILPVFADAAGQGARGTTWLRAHARYDDAHPAEALEIVKQATDDDGPGGAAAQAAVRAALTRSLELLGRGLEASFRAGA